MSHTVDLSLSRRIIRRAALAAAILSIGLAASPSAALAYDASGSSGAARLALDAAADATAQEPAPAPPPPAENPPTPPPETPSPAPSNPPSPPPPAPAPAPAPGTAPGTQPGTPPGAPAGQPAPGTPPAPATGEVAPLTPPTPAKPPAPPPRPGDVETNAGLVTLQAGDLTGARLHFEKALAVDPGHPVARNRMAYIKFRTTDFAGAANDAGIATSADPGDALSWVILGRAQEALGFPDKAAAAYSSAAPLSKTAKTAEQLVSSALAHYLLAILRIRKGDATGVEDDLKEMLRIYPKNAYGLYELGSFYARAGRNDDAAEALEKASTAFPDFHPQEGWVYPNRRYTFLDVNLRYWLGVARLGQGGTEAAITELETVIPRAESLAGADVMKQQSASTAALEGTIDRSFANVHYEAALAYQKKGDTSKASSLLKTCLRLDIADADTLKKAKDLQKQIR